MFKKQGAILLTILYVITAVGFALNLHYCGKTITAVKIDAPAKGCSNKQMSRMKCCTEKQIDVKIKDAHQSEAVSTLAKVFHFTLPQIHLRNFFLSLPQSFINRVFDYTPSQPPSDSIATFIKNCIFRI